MAYFVHEIFLSIQGEGFNTGRPAVFCRFSGCNLWSGREEHRGGAVCWFCDTEFVGVDGDGGGRFEAAEDLADAVVSAWAAAPATPFVVCTGGEPLLQLDAPLLAALRARRCTVALETNGTLPVPDGIDWVCVSPKSGAALRVTSGDELKLVYPQPGLEPGDVEDLAFDHFFLQPLDGDHRQDNTGSAVRYCLTHPQWRVSLQVHKYIGVR